MIKFNELSEEDKIHKALHEAFMSCQSFVCNTFHYQIDGIDEYMQYKKDMIDYLADKLGMNDLKGHLYPSGTCQTSEPK